ncbi:unnamed protein product [Moneuplotes crassus]|uniref:C2HC/C3H-type domain-containing protein n=1 Tax=Euplotes crassus TaxID=5936 RepID=A0AAD1UI11_EUPCR|nr:unnamed protein product [Moneuplotes crassus]
MRGEGESSTIEVKNKPKLQSNPLKNFQLPGEVISDKVLKARQGLLLLKSKLNRQTTFSTDFKAPKRGTRPEVNTNIFKPSLKQPNYRKTFQPKFEDDKFNTPSASSKPETQAAHRVDQLPTAIELPPSLPVAPKHEETKMEAQENPSKFPTARKPQPRERRAAPKPKVEEFTKPPPVAHNSEGTLIMPVTETFEKSASQVSKPLGNFKVKEASMVQMPTESFVVNSTQNKPPAEMPRNAQSPEGSNFSGGSPTLPPEQASEDVPLSSCHLCGRTFNEKALGIHLKSCKGKTKPKTKVPKTVPKKKAVNSNKWRSESEQFRAVMKAARTGKPMEVQIVDDGLVPCPHCKRTFNEHAAKRHIEDCGTRAKFMANRNKKRR